VLSRRWFAWVRPGEPHRDRCGSGPGTPDLRQPSAEPLAGLRRWSHATSGRRWDRPCPKASRFGPFPVALMRPGRQTAPPGRSYQPLQAQHERPSRF